MGQSAVPTPGIRVALPTPPTGSVLMVGVTPNNIIRFAPSHPLNPRRQGLPTTYLRDRHPPPPSRHLDPIEALTSRFGILNGKLLASPLAPLYEPEGRVEYRDGRLLLHGRHATHPASGQRRVNVFRGDASRTTIASADLSEWPHRFKVTFDDGHETIVPAWIVNGRTLPHLARWRAGIVPVTTWNRAIQDGPPTEAYDNILAGPGMASLLYKIRTYGFAFVHSMPPTPSATKSLLETIGPIRNTHYGGFYDFTSDLASKDTAYTSEALEPHTDNTYFSDPAGLQALHLLSHTDGSGGESSLVDGFAAAATLYRTNPAAYLKLSSTSVHAHASGNDGVSIQPYRAFPTFTHTEHTSRRSGTLLQVRWNNADRAGVAVRSGVLDAWYEAAGAFDALLNDPKNQYWFQLKPGRMLLIDNWRVLHGRAAFTGQRRICGGYINHDDFISKVRVTNYSQEEIRQSTVSG
ncbi:hypothetical protein LTR53_017636 [Teratosphaeriaceae sp. CCFEE 6253]|nr:hypothetical protein LTR53_017636 [Teratosphaeriaceae sp. CCFEE 6253]